ncbi:RT0821/Lpp0805 family surface protein [Hoeflea prorocentri]|uniref:RT0821/Lpp0805 family surface protein n=1 Tax=Hoeflea prorocentri TaxID=1922333 RepID=A0A9X3UIY7_9HYPH|nr:RT0821/Lpp0805 family surface protein [Hoeflea prorocentri]MCY6381670.1 RT0821/Lpp0805 family surface protein [Hoeflea prorocentri]MDA5399470.1 RT0821/Lpp0805 family surface protein [Hoeflea prorocentri]
MTQHVSNINVNALLRRGTLNITWRLALFALVLIPVSGCVSSGFDLGLSDEPDTTIQSGSVDPALGSATDDAVIADAVATAKIEPGLVQDVPWSNIATGNFGSVSFIRENKSVGKVCRDFIVSKHSYDGISQYTGEICRTRLTKSWTLNSLSEQG